MKNEKNEIIETRSMGSIIYEKYLDQLERSSLDKILDISGRIALGVTFSTVMIMGGELRQALMAHDMLALKAIAGMGLGWYRKPAIEIAQYVKACVLETLKSEDRKDLGLRELGGVEICPLLIDGVEVEKIADFIFSTRGWARDGVEKLGLGRTQSEKIGKGLDRVGAFVRGEKNARVLTEGYDLESLILVLSNYAELGEFTATERKEFGE